MAEDNAQRTEEPTPRRQQKSREEGQVPSSREFTAALQFTAAVGMLGYFGVSIYLALARVMRGLFREAFRQDLTVGRLEALSAAVAGDSLRFLAYSGAVLLVIGALTHMSQTGFLLSPKRLAPDVKRLNPLQKIKDLPGENLAQTAKAVVLLPLVAVVFWYVVQSELETFLLLPKMGLAAGASTVASALFDLLIKASLALLALGAFDYYRQRRKLHTKLMMTKQEVRQEHKDLEGNPQIKARLRRLQRERMRRRMMSEVPKASVVITNPTHYAVAVRYDPDSMAAPVVVAKGLDFLALRIREVAENHRIPIVENPPLAQALYKSAEIGMEIPEQLYRAMAEVLAYIYKLRGERPL